MIRWTKNLKDISIFKSYESIFTFNKQFDAMLFIIKIRDSLIKIDPDNIFDISPQIDEAMHHINQLILSLAPFSYKDEAYDLQNKFNRIREFIEKIPNTKTSFSEFRELLLKNMDKDFDSLEIILSKDKKSLNKNTKNKFPNIFKTKDKQDKEKIEESNSKQKNEQKTDNFNLNISIIEKKISDFINKDEDNNLSDKSQKNGEIVDNKSNFDNNSSKAEIKKRINIRNNLLQALLDIYHDKKNGYKLMLAIFRGLDVYRRMCLSGDSFNKEAYILNIKKSLTLYKDANLFNLLIQKNSNFSIDDLQNMIIDCLRIMNKQIDKSRFKLYFDDKLNYRSGFNSEFQQKVEWLYLPEKRRPKRNLDELYTIKSVTDGMSKSLQSSKNYSSFLSSRDIDICNKILSALHTIYYRDSKIRKFLIKLFYSLDDFEYNKHEFTEVYKEEFKNNFQNSILDNNKNFGLVKIVTQMNPKINPTDVKTLLPTTLRIMKEKIDVGFERKKKEDPTLQNSFNPTERYYRIYDKKLFRIYRRL